MTDRQRRTRQLRVVETVTSPVLVGPGGGAPDDDAPGGRAGTDHRPVGGGSGTWAWLVPDRVEAELSGLRRAVGLRAEGFVRASTDGIWSVSPHEVVAYGGLGVLALMGAVEAPVIAAVAGLAWMTRPVMPALPPQR
ncbi:hypothetical protein LQ327_06765 [Actinomycetospora endophytica]|uniref:Uncharacterized protein n=1 Tax=Actinomycetospora endophytica TaxID=2291215 RepID=A0ABS8P7R2_9PSEU|nr:hypothetical protein [Actinomycetospora endophytica]MCD2193089.1 hypothetical protein [Actinomycetospora endophytica]